MVKAQNQGDKFDLVGSHFWLILVRDEKTTSLMCY